MLEAETKTVSRLLREGIAYLEERDIPSSRQEAERLLASLLALRRIDLYTSPDRPISSGEEARLWIWLQRRGRREPLQYITGEVSFDGLSLAVEPGVFIPRPETELMVEFARSRLAPPRKILDLCTGSGALAVALAKAFPAAGLVATDCSEKALAVARLNAERHDCSPRITLLKGDLFGPLESEAVSPDTPAFDLIVCNPPYIPERDRPDLQPEVRDYEPAAALFAPEEGTAFYRRIVQLGGRFLAPQGTLLLELGDRQASWFERLTSESDWAVTFIPDLSGVDRIAICIKRSDEEARPHG